MDALNLQTNLDSGTVSKNQNGDQVMVFWPQKTITYKWNIRS